MRIFDKSGGKPLPDLDEGTLKDLGEWCQYTRQRSDAARDSIERALMDDMRQYAGVPPIGQRYQPSDDRPGLEMTIGAIGVDGIYANFIELVTQTDQLVSVIPRKKFEQYADAVQDYIDWGCRESFNVEQALNIGSFECIRLGTMAFYIPWVEKIRVTDRVKIIDRGPRIIPLVFEDFHLPEGSQGAIQTDPWCEMDIWVTSRNDLDFRAKQGKWAYYEQNRNNIQRAGNIHEMTQRRYDVARDNSAPAADEGLYHFAYRCAEYDIDGDGINEEIEVLRDASSGTVVDVRFPTYQVRPFEMAVYQIQPGLAWGLGVQRMSSVFQEEISILHTERIQNARLANVRLWKAKRSIAPFLTAPHPGKVIEVSDMDDFTGEKMADIYPSSVQAEMMDISFVERRTGASELAAGNQHMGTRTPVGSAMAIMQAGNRRFTPPFRNMRNCYGAVIRQCVYRVQERIQLKDKAAIDDVTEVLGEEKAHLFIELCEKADNLIDAFDAQITASSISINREADRQSFLMLMNLWMTFQTQRLKLMQFGELGPATPRLKALAEAIEESGLRLLKRFLRTFETISDVDAYLAEVKGLEELGGQLPQDAQQGLAGFTQHLMQMMQNRGPVQGAEQGQNGAGPPPMPPPSSNVAEAPLQ